MLSGCGSSGQSADASANGGATEHIALGLASNTAANWPLYVEQRLDLFKKYKLDVQVIRVSSVAANAQQLTAGSLDIADISSTQIVEAVQGGAPLRYILNRVSTPPYEIVARKGVSSAEQLKGKLVIVGGVNDITRILAEGTLQAAGLAPSQYDLTYAGGTNERYAALKSGSVGAAILSSPYNFRAEADGGVAIGSVEKLYHGFPFTGFGVAQAWGRAHHDAVVRFVEAHLDAVKWLYDPQNRQRAIEILASATGTTNDDAGKTYAEVIARDHAFSTTGATTPSDMKRVVGALTQLGQVKGSPSPESFYDNSYAVDAAKALAHAGN